MTFTTIVFVFIFLPIVFLLYVGMPQKFKNIFLLVASLFFYAWGNVSHVLLLCAIILMNYGFGHYIDRAKGKRRKQHVVEAIVFNVVVLFYFKYYGFVLESVFAFFPQPPAYSLFSVPLGISFFTFSLIAYVIDVYRKQIVAEHNLIDFALFVSFFPKLIMGPIERYAQMKEQIKHHPIKRSLLERGSQTFLMGLAMKLLLANTMGIIWSTCHTMTPSLLSAWLGILAYTFQIYFDFQGYTLMAIGLGKIFGFHLSKNFHYPYIACSITDFWRRWHMTLSAWFKDYVYIPLGGNRTTFNKALRNLLIVWILTGIWHGANWTFIVWGLYYGILLIVEKYILCEFLKKLPKVIRWLSTFVIVMIGWVFFASDTIMDAFHYLGNMLMLNGNGFVDLETWYLLTNYGIYFVACILCATPYLKKAFGKLSCAFQNEMWYLKPIFTICIFLILLSFMVSDTYQAFLYFKF